MKVVVIRSRKLSMIFFSMYEIEIFKIIFILKRFITTKQEMLKRILEGDKKEDGILKYE